MIFMIQLAGKMSQTAPTFVYHVPLPNQLIALWKLVAKFGCPNKLINIICQFREGMTGRRESVSSEGDLFTFINGVKIGCVLASSLFGLFFAAVLEKAFCLYIESLYMPPYW